VYIPNWITNIDVMWEDGACARFLERLGSFCRVICFDKRGTGLSDPVRHEPVPSLEPWMDDLNAVLDAVDSDTAALLGWDAGGMLAMLFAATFPERASHLVLGDAYARMLRTDDYPIGAPTSALEAFLALFNESSASTWETGAYWDLAAPDYASNLQRKEWLTRFTRLACPPQLGAAIARTALEWDLRSVLGSIQAPVLVMSHQNKHYIRSTHGRYLAEHLANARFVELAGRDTLAWTADVDTIVSETRALVTGAIDTGDSDRVLATLLFTDLVGSTDRAATAGDRAWRELLDAHDAVVARQITAYRGRHINTTGDGVLAAFDGPARGIRCAAAIRRELAELNLDVKAGLHTGEIELRGRDVGGLAVHIAARVMGAASAGEVIVSRTVKDLVAGSGIDFEDLGERELKGVPERWQLFRARL
jgi:class 3 adenylate cyclase